MDNQQNRLRRDDLANLGENILSALNINARNITRLALVIEGPHFLPVLTVERILVDAHSLEGVRSVLEQYSVVPVSPSASASGSAPNISTEGC